MGALIVYILVRWPYKWFLITQITDRNTSIQQTHPTKPTNTPPLKFASQSKFNEDDVFCGCAHAHYKRLNIFMQYSTQRTFSRSTKTL